MSIMLAGFIIVENELMNFEPDFGGEEAEEQALIGVALVIGNGNYTNWPSPETAHTDATKVCQEMEKLGYRVIFW